MDQDDADEVAAALQELLNGTTPGKLTYQPSASSVSVSSTSQIGAGQQQQLLAYAVGSNTNTSRSVGSRVGNAHAHSYLDPSLVAEEGASYQGNQQNESTLSYDPVRAYVLSLSVVMNVRRPAYACTI
jgi:hypothetical protein